VKRALLYFVGALVLSQMAVWMDMAAILRAVWAVAAVFGGLTAALIAEDSQ
jgi:hypothetical protein